MRVKSAGAAPHLKVRPSNHCLDEVGPLQLCVLEVAVSAVCCCEVGPSQVLQGTPHCILLPQEGVSSASEFCGILRRLYLVMEVFALDVCLSILLSCPDVEFTTSSSLILVQISPALSIAEE